MKGMAPSYLDLLENEGLLDRQLEFLPTDKQIAERQSMGSGLRAPEFAVMIAYTKLADVDELLDSDLPDEPMLDADLLRYFPEAMRSRYPEAIRNHRLRREIIATMIVNEMVNLAGRHAAQPAMVAAARMTCSSWLRFNEPPPRGLVAR